MIIRGSDGVLRDDLVIPQGSTWNRSWNITDLNGIPLDVTGWSVRSQIRVSPQWPAVLFEWATAPTAGMGTAVITGSSLQIRLTGGADSALWVFTAGFYDVLLRNPSNEPTRIVEGAIRISPSITH